MTAADGEHHALNLPIRPSLAQLARPSSLNLHPALGVQTRMRARSVTSGSGSSTPALVQQHLSPTLAGSPIFPSHEHFLDGARIPPSGEVPSARRRTIDDDGDDYGVPGTEEGGSTESESPPATPADAVAPLPALRMGDDGSWASRYRADSDPLKRERKTVDDATRVGIRRGKSFTSLLMPAVGTPGSEIHDPIPELPTPPASDDGASLGSDVVDEEAALFPPTASDSFETPLPKKTIFSFVPQLAVLAVLFFGSFALLAILIATLPNLFIPHALADLPQLTKTLSAYRASSFNAEFHVFGVLTALFLWKQCFSIPGSILTNILFGALYGTTLATIWACLWTAVGSMGAYGIARVVSPLVEHYFATPLAMTRKALNLADPALATAPIANNAATVTTTSADLFTHLLLARFFPLLPYSVLNVISGVLSIPLTPFFVTLILGSFPFNFATVSVGSLISLSLSNPNASPLETIWSPEVIFKLVGVTAVSVVPVLFKERIKRALSGRKIAAFGQILSQVFAPRSGVAGGVTLRLRRDGADRRKANKSWAPGDNWVSAAMRRSNEPAGRTRGQTSSADLKAPDIMGRWDGDGFEDNEMEMMA